MASPFLPHGQSCSKYCWLGPQSTGRNSPLTVFDYCPPKPITFLLDYQPSLLPCSTRASIKAILYTVVRVPLKAQVRSCHSVQSPLVPPTPTHLTQTCRRLCDPPPPVLSSPWPHLLPSSCFLHSSYSPPNPLPLPGPLHLLFLFLGDTHCLLSSQSLIKCPHTLEKPSFTTLYTLYLPSPPLSFLISFIALLAPSVYLFVYLLLGNSMQPRLPLVLFKTLGMQQCRGDNSWPSEMLESTWTRLLQPSGNLSVS